MAIPIILFLFLITTVSCNSFVTKKLDNYKQLKSFVSTQDQKQFIKSQMLYIEDFYKPSQDPYTGTSRITENCSENNLFYPLFEGTQGVFISAHIYLTKNEYPGACQDTPDRKKVTYIISNCANSDKINHGYFPGHIQKSNNEIIEFLCGM